MAAHSVVAGMQKAPADVVEAIRNDAPIADPRLEALRNFTTAVVDRRGWVGPEDVDAFIEAGFTRAQVIEVVLGVTLKMLTTTRITSPTRRSTLRLPAPPGRR